MPPTASYRDLKSFGLEFVTPQDAQFSALLQEIQNRPQPIGPRAVIEAGAPAAILLNRSGKAIVALEYVWKYFT